MGNPEHYVGREALQVECRVMGSGEIFYFKYILYLTRKYNNVLLSSPWKWTEGTRVVKLYCTPTSDSGES